MNGKSAHLWLPRDQWYRRYKIHKAAIKFWTFTVILTLKTKIWFLHKALQLMMMYHPIIFGYKKISTSADMVETVIFDQMSPHSHSDPRLEDRKTIFLHDDVASPYQVWLNRRFRSGGDIIQINIPWNSEPFLWPWAGPKQSNPIFSQNNPPYDDVPSNQLWLQKDQQFRKYIKKVIFWLYYPNCDLDLEDSKPIFFKDNMAPNDASPCQVWL